jgi:hypothetical protein
VGYLPGLIFGVVFVVAGCVLIAFRKPLAQRTSKGEDRFFGRKRDLAKPDSTASWIGVAGIVFITLGVIAAIRAFLP